MRDIGHEYTDDLLNRLESELNATYSQAYRELKKKQEQYMADYEKQLKKKKEQLNAGDIDQDDFDAWQRGQLMGAEWYKQMVETLSADMVTVDKKAASIINGYTPDAYAENANFGAFQIEKQGMVDTSFTMYDRDTVERLVAEQPDLLPYVEIDETKDKRWNKKKFTSAITQSVLQGESIPAAAKRLKTVIGMDKASSMRSARTAITGAENSGRVHSYKRAQAMGIKLKKEWVATLDKRTRDTHARLDGERVEIGKKFSNGLMYPGDPNGVGSEVYNCRCTLVAAVEGVNQSDAERNSKLGNMSYDEWKKGDWRKNG